MKHNTKVRGIISVISVIATIIGIIVGIFLRIHDYNHRYDANAVSCGAFKVTFNSNNNEGAVTINPSAGKLFYGTMHVNGSEKLYIYHVYYKDSHKYTYKYDNTLYFRNPYKGKTSAEYYLRFNKHTARMDIKIRRSTPTKSTNTLEFDFAVH